MVRNPGELGSLSSLSRREPLQHSIHRLPGIELVMQQRARMEKQYPVKARSGSSTEENPTTGEDQAATTGLTDETILTGKGLAETDTLARLKIVKVTPTGDIGLDSAA